jgi:hypothetical protein
MSSEDDVRMRVLRLNLHFDLPTDLSIPDAIRRLADFLEQPLDAEGIPHHLSQNNTHGAFYHNLKLGCRLTGSAAICTLYDDNKPWVITQHGLVDLKRDFGSPDFIIIK